MPCPPKTESGCVSTSSVLGVRTLRNIPSLSPPHHVVLSGSLLKYQEQAYSLYKAGFCLSPEESYVVTEKIKTSKLQVKGTGGWGSSEGPEKQSKRFSPPIPFFHPVLVLPNSGHTHQQEALEKIQGGGNTQLSPGEILVRLQQFCLSSDSSLL